MAVLVQRIRRTPFFHSTQYPPVQYFFHSTQYEVPNFFAGASPPHPRKFSQYAVLFRTRTPISDKRHSTQYAVLFGPELAVRSTPQTHPNRSPQKVRSTRSTPPTALAEKFTVLTVPPQPLLEFF